MAELKLTKREQDSIKALKRIAATWPKSLWLFSADGTLWVMRKVDGKRKVLPHGGMDQAYAIEAIHLENDGGDW